MAFGPELQAALAAFDKWWSEEQQRRDIAESVDQPLYHYTDASGLVGILKSQEIWFTSIFHMNDPGELAYGVKIANDILAAAAIGRSAPIQTLCEVMASKLSDDIGKIFGYYVACFSRLGDDLGQWRGYGNNGRGFALGLAPHLFHISARGSLPPNETVFVANVDYERQNTDSRNREATKRALDILQDAIDRALIKTSTEGAELQKELSILLTPPLLWNSITAKHQAYKHELETRLMIVNSVASLAPFVETRVRGSSLVPFIKSPMPLQKRGSITEIIIGPAADSGTEDAVSSLLRSMNLHSHIKVRRSEIPYKAV